MKTNKLLIVFACLVSLVCKAQTRALPVNEVSSDLATDKKNVLFIAVDDLKPLLSNYGHPEMITPNFDRLAKMGATFTNAQVQYAVCGPSRASVMTGTYPDITKVWDRNNFV